MCQIKLSDPTKPDANLPEQKEYQERASNSIKGDVNEGPLPDLY